MHQGIRVASVVAFATLSLVACGGDDDLNPGDDTAAPTTTASPPGGAFPEALSVSLSCDDGPGSGCTATHYTTDGSGPTRESALYAGPLSITATTTLRFFSVDAAGNVEPVRQEVYAIGPAPEVVGVTPAAGTAHVSADADITVEFSEPMNAASLSAASIVLEPAVAGTVSYDAATSTATFSPSLPLAFATGYTVTVTTAAQSAEGVPLASAYTWHFEVENSPVLQVSVGSSAIHHHPAVAYNDAGDGLAVWIGQERAGVGRIFFAGYDADEEQWNEEQSLTTDVGHRAVPVVVSNGATWAIAAGRHLVVVSRSEGEWQAGPVKAADNSTLATIEHLATDGDSYMAVWERSNAVRAMRHDGTAWPVTYETISSLYARNPTLAGFPGGYFLAWQFSATSTGIPSIYAAFHREDGWLPAQEIDETAERAENPVAHVGADGGGLAVAWQQGPTSHTQLAFREYTPVDAGVFGAIELFGGTASGNHRRFPRLSSVTSGYGLLWLEGNTVSTRTVHAQERVAGTWSTATTLSTAAMVVPEHRLIANVGGYAAVWSGATSTSDDEGPVHASVWSGAWSERVTLAETASHEVGFAALGTTGNRLAVSLVEGSAAGWLPILRAFSGTAWNSTPLATTPHELPPWVALGRSPGGLVALWATGPSVFARALGQSPVHELTQLEHPSAIFNHQAASNDAGELLVVWDHLDGSHRALVARRFDGRQWLAPAVLARSTNLNDDFDPQVAGEGDRFSVLFTQGDGARVARVLSADGWTDAETLIEERAMAKLLVLEGQFVVVLGRVDDTELGTPDPLTADITLRRYGTSWEPAETLAAFAVGPADTSGFGIEEMDALSSAAGLLVVWSGQLGAAGERALHTVVVDESGATTAAIPLASDQDYPDFSFASDGQSFAVAWSADEGDGEGAVAFHDAAGWTAPLVVHGPNASAPLHLLASTDGYMVLWGEDDELLSARSSQGVLSAPEGLASGSEVIAGVGSAGGYAALYEDAGEHWVRTFEGSSWGTAHALENNVFSHLAGNGVDYAICTTGWDDDTPVRVARRRSEGWEAFRAVSRPGYPIADPWTLLLLPVRDHYAVIWMEDEGGDRAASLWAQAAF